MLHITVDYFSLVEVLLDDERLTETEALSRTMVERAVEQLIAEAIAEHRSQR